MPKSVRALSERVPGEISVDAGNFEVIRILLRKRLVQRIRKLIQATARLAGKCNTSWLQIDRSRMPGWWIRLVTDRLVFRRLTYSMPGTITRSNWSSWFPQLSSISSLRHEPARIFASPWDKGRWQIVPDRRLHSLKTPTFVRFCRYVFPGCDFSDFKFP